jgi:pimeloyl-ACP methyl ester carboxylesterase/predicted glycosyltransferase
MTPDTHGVDAVSPPDVVGVARRGEVDLAWRSHGRGEPTLLLLPTWQIVDSRIWKAQVGHLSRHYRVVTYDGRGSGGSGIPRGPAAYSNQECAEDVVGVLDATGTSRAVLVALSCGVTWAIHAAADHPDRVSGIVAISPSCGLPIARPGREVEAFDRRQPDPRGWGMYNRYYWTEGDFDTFRRFFFEQMYSEPHSTKQLEDALRWSSETDPDVLSDATAGRLGLHHAACEPVEHACRRVQCPVMVVHGTEDRVRPAAVGHRLAELTGASLVLVRGGGHGILNRDPVKVNRLISDFVGKLAAAQGEPREARATWVRAAARPRRVLYLCSPIGLGHAARDLAIVRRLRELDPDVQVDWLAQPPVTAVLESAGERVHPASAYLASETGHFERESGEHVLHAFQALRRMDAILVHNFMVFAEVVEREQYDLVVGDEAWDVDYFLHENPELKRFGFAWLTDFVGYLPMPSGGAAEQALTRDYNAEMIEQRARFARVRDRSIFVGSPEDVVPESFGAGLPLIRDWMAENFDFAGYVSGFDPGALAERSVLRPQCGFSDDRPVCVVTVGGTGVGRSLLERVLDAVPIARRQVRELQFLVVTGPRIDPDSLPRRRGAVVRGYVPRLYEHLAASDVAIVQGGLTTCMELTASRRPFVYVPLRDHFEQNIHVHHRLQRYGAGQCLRYDQAADPDLLAATVVAQLGRAPEVLPVETDGASRAAAMLAQLL